MAKIVPRLKTVIATRNPVENDPRALLSRREIRAKTLSDRRQRSRREIRPKTLAIDDSDRSIAARNPPQNATRF